MGSGAGGKMRLASFSIAGCKGYGIVVEGGAIDLSRRLGAGAPSLRAAIAAGGVEPMRALVEEPADVAMGDIALDLPIPDAAKILCVGRNYRGHVAEGNLKLPEKPSVFLRATESFVPCGGGWCGRGFRESSTMRASLRSSSRQAGTAHRREEEERARVRLYLTGDSSMND